MLLTAAREAIVATCQELSRAGLVVGTAGNVSVRDGDLVAVTPSGVRYATLTPDLVGVHRLDGSPVEAPLAPTSEMALHLAVYAARPEVRAVVHTHSPAATALSALVDEVPAVHYYTELFGGPPRVAPYATYGTEELARNVVHALRDRAACLMGNHGAVAVGPDLATAHEKCATWSGCATCTCAPRRRAPRVCCHRLSSPSSPGRWRRPGGRSPAMAGDIARIIDSTLLETN